MVPNRRIGERVFVGATELTRKPVANTGGETKYALLMDLSVTGAGLFGPTYPWRGSTTWRSWGEQRNVPS